MNKLLSFIAIICCFVSAVAMNYSNTNFNSTQPGWSDTLTIYNNNNAPVSLHQISFDSNYPGLNAATLYGTLHHAQKFTSVKKISPYDYHYILAVKATIAAHGSAELTQIPLVHQQQSQQGIPLYYRLPFNVSVLLGSGTIVKLPLKNACQGVACDNPVVGKMSASYYTNWANYSYANDPSNMLMPNQVPVRQLNTVFYDVGKINPHNADISFLDINHDQYYLPAFDTLKQQYPYLNLIYSFGGWGDAGVNSYPSYDFAHIFDQDNPQLIATLAKNMVNTMQEIGFNGVDVDYEWAAIQPGTTQPMHLTPLRAKGYMELMHDLHNDIAKIQPANHPHYYRLTTAIFCGIDKIHNFINNGGNWKTVAADVDDMDVMTYDMHGQFDANGSVDAITGFLSAMQTAHRYHNPTFNHYNVVDAVTEYEKLGVPKSKIVIGIPAYTRIEKSSVAVTKQNKGLYLPLAPMADQPKGEQHHGGMTDYKCIVNNRFCWPGYSFNRQTLVQVPVNMSSTGLGAKAKTPWAYDASLNWFLSFDNGRSADYKAAWVKQHGLAGVMVWEIDGDIPNTATDYKQDSIIYNMWKGLQ